MSISVAMCTYNGEKYVAEQVRSIYSQTRPPDELVISDDASVDNSISAVIHSANQSRADALADSGAKKLMQIRLLRNSAALGITKNFEQAVSASTGDLIALCDQDDVWHNQRLEVVEAEFSRRPDLLLLHSDANLVGANGAPIGMTLFEALEVRPFEFAWIAEGRALDVYLRRNLATGATTVLRRSLLDYALPFPPEWLHDEWLAVIAAVLGGADVLQRSLIDYRQHPANQIGARQEPLYKKLQKAFSTRDQTLAKRALKIEILLTRILSLGDIVPPQVIDKIEDKLTHQRFRAALPAPRIKRCIPVLREALTGRYMRFGRPVHCIARDLFESG